MVGNTAPPPVSSGTNAGSGDRTLKFNCYLVFFLMFLFSVSGPAISRPGVFLLWLAAPFAAARRLNVRAFGRHVLWLFLAIGATAGILSGSRYLPPILCVAVSAVFWGLYLCRGVLASQPAPFQTVCHAAITSFFSDPWAFFALSPNDSKTAREARLLRGSYIGFLLLALLVAATLLVVLADARIESELRDFLDLFLRQAPVIASCLILAFFPAAFAYGFITGLARPSSNWPSSSASAVPANYTAILPWFAPCLLLLVINCVFLLAEIYYARILGDNPLPASYNFYDVFSILALISISIAVLLCRPNSATNRERAYSVCLCIVDAGLLFIAGFRLYNYILYHGLWEDRLLLCAFFLLLCFLSLVILFLSLPRRFSRAGQKVGIAVALISIVVFAIPKGLLLTGINVSCFISKYNARQLCIQRAGSTEVPIPLSVDDLNLEAFKIYGVDGVPALAKLAGISDVVYQEQTLGDYAKETVLDILRSDLGLESTGNMAADIQNIYNTSAFTPRYRLPTTWSVAIRSVKEIEFDVE